MPSGVLLVARRNLAIVIRVGAPPHSLEPHSQGGVFTANAPVFRCYIYFTFFKKTVCLNIELCLTQRTCPLCNGGQKDFRKTGCDKGYAEKFLNDF